MNRLYVQAVHSHSSCPKIQAQTTHVLICRFIYSVERLTSFHTSIVDTLRASLLNALPQVTGMLQALLLEVLQRRAAKLPDLMTDVRPMLPTLLASHNHALQNNALQLLKVLLPGETDDATGKSCFASPSVSAKGCTISRGLHSTSKACIVALGVSLGIMCESV